MHSYLWNCLCLVPFLFSLYVHYFLDSHVFHSFPVFGCLLNDQQQRIPHQTEKDLDMDYVLQYFHFRDCFLYPREYSQTPCFGPSMVQPCILVLVRSNVLTLHREKNHVGIVKKITWVNECRIECVNLEKNCKGSPTIYSALPNPLRPTRCRCFLRRQQGLGFRCERRRRK